MNSSISVNSPINKNVCIGAAAGACVGLPKIISGAKGLIDIKCTEKTIAENVLKHKNVSDTFKKIAETGLVTTSQEAADAFAHNIDNGLEMDKLFKSTNEFLGDLGAFLKKSYKGSIKQGLIYSAIGATAVGVTVAVVNKIKSHKINNTENN